MTVGQRVKDVFEGRHGHGGSKRIKHREMTRGHLSAILKQLRDDERKRAAGIAASHQDDDERSASVLSLQIQHEILYGPS